MAVAEQSPGWAPVDDLDLWILVGAWFMPEWSLSLDSVDADEKPGQKNILFFYQTGDISPF